MKFLGRNMVLRLFMALCAFAQVAAVTAHHHHDSSDAPCINPLHCVETTAHSHNGDEPSGCGHEHGTGDTSQDKTCLDTGSDDCVAACNGHFCLHNTAAHPHGNDGEDCSFSHLDLNPPAKDRVNLEPPVLKLDYIFITAYPPLVIDTPACKHGGDGELVCCSARWGTLTLYSHYLTAAIPPRAPSVLA